MEVSGQDHNLTASNAGLVMLFFGYQLLLSLSSLVGWLVGWLVISLVS
jgi:inner membrane protein involved in colicin E2 resistance